MRRLLPLIAVPGILLVGCSKTEDAAPATTTSVVITDANKTICADLTTFSNKLADGVKNIAGATPEATATNVQNVFVSLRTNFDALKAEAPADLAPAIDVYVVEIQKVSERDPKNPSDQQALNAMFLAPSAEMKTAETSLRTWASTNCGITLPGA